MRIQRLMKAAGFAYLFFSAITLAAQHKTLQPLILSSLITVGPEQTPLAQDTYASTLQHAKTLAPEAEPDPARIHACPNDSMPTIRYELVPDGTTLVNNYFRFYLEWPSPDATCFHNPPTPIVTGQSTPPQWVYFWNFGDGTYAGNSVVTHAFNPGTFNVEVALKPTYTDDHDPFKKAKMQRALAVPDPSTTTTATKPVDNRIIDPGSNLKLAVNWQASRPTGMLTFAVSYRMPANSEGQVIFLFPDYMFDAVHTDWAPSIEQGQSVAIPADVYTTAALDGYSWSFKNNTNIQHDTTLFIDLRVPLNVQNSITNTSTVQENVYAAIAFKSGAPANDQTVPGGSDNVPVVKTAAPPPLAKQPQSFFDLLFGTTKTDETGTVTSPYDYNTYEEQFMPIAVNWASDPNFMIVEPTVLEPGSSNNTLTYTAGFQNDGTASANKLTISVGVDPLLLAPSVSTLQRNPGCINNIPAIENDSLIWSNIPKNPNIPPSCSLPSLGDARKLGFAEDQSWGLVKYQIQTPSTPLIDGQVIRAQAIIRMDAGQDTTDICEVRVGTPAFCYVNLFGLKYTQQLVNDEHRNGLGIALTLRRPLGKVKNPGFEVRKTGLINLNNFPLFWWQAELGYGQTKLQYPMSDSFFLRHIDATPFMLRFIAKKPPLKFGSKKIERGWGISAGYTASYLFSSRRNGSDDTGFDQFSFTERLDHSISVSGDFLNLIGHPGLSVGAGWRWRNSNITGQRQWYQNAFVYLHYTFSYRFRKEFGWL